MEYLLKSSAIIALFYICYRLFLDKETYFTSNRLYLLTGIVIAFIIPFIVIPIYVIKEPVDIDFLSTATISQTSIDTEKQTINLLTFLPYIYVAGVVVMLLKSAIEFTSLYNVLRNCKKHSKEQFIFFQTKKTISPFSFFNVIVYNPEMFEKNELEHIVAHEKVHARQWHSFDVLVAHAACILLWFNPFVWLYKKEVQQNLEFIADQTAQRQANCSKTYQHLLLKTSLNNTQLILANNFYNSLIKKRIVMLHKNPSNRRNQWKLLLILPLMLAFIFTFNTKVIAQTKEKEKKTVKKIENNDVFALIITKDSNDKDLDDVKAKMKEQGVSVSFKKIKRNDAGEITSISINASGKKSNASYSLDNDSPISDIIIKYNEDEDSLSIGNTKNLHFSSGKNHTWVTKGSNDDHVVIEIDTDDDSEGENSFVFVTSDKGKHKVHKKVEVIEIEGDDHEVIEIKEGKSGAYVIKKEVNADEDGEKEVEMIIESSDGKDLKWVGEEGDKKVKAIVKSLDTGEEDEIIIIKSSDKNMFFMNKDEGEPLIFINDKESTKEEMEKLNPNEIQSVDVLKGNKAIEKYGDKAKDGVIKITTKKQ